MKKTFISGVLLCVLVAVSVNAAPIIVENHSFELPAVGHENSVLPTDWYHEGGGGYGIEALASVGDQCAFLSGNDSAYYQLTSHTIAEGEEYELIFDACRTWTTAERTATFTGILYYDDGGSKLTIDSVSGSASTNGDWVEYSLAVSIPSGHAAIGNQLGIKFIHTTVESNDTWAGFDNVRLSVATSNTATNPIPSSGSSDIAPGVVLYWTAPTGPTGPDYNVYLGHSTGSLALVSPAQSATNYDPPGDLQNDRIYYWQVDTIDGMDVYTGDLWYFTTQRTGAKVFYIDSVTGNDGNDGLSPGQPWQTLAPVNTMTFIPGDKILFKADTSYTGQLKPQGSGSDGNPIIIDMYETGNKPAINGEGILDTVLLENVEYCEVSNLEITNLGPTRQNWRTGIKLWSNGYGTVHHIHLKDLYVHDVNGSLDKNTEGCGIYIESSGSTQSRFDDVLVENCHVLRTDRNGICMRSDFVGRSSDWYPSLNVIIRYNLVEDCGGDAIKPWGADGCRVEHNIVDRARQRCSDYAAGIWPWSCDNTVIQFNEVSGVKGTLDGQGFDSDYNCQNSIFQYNYSHDNDGGFMLICGPSASSWDIGNIGTIVRYNISQNDGLNSARVFHISGGGVDNTTIYNNVIYVGPSQNLPLLLFGNWDGWPNDTKFYNNIFYADGTATYNLGSSTNNVFENNVFYGNHTSPPFDPCGITSDPLLVSAGSGGSGLDSVDGYKLTASSPCITAGQTVAANGKFDYFRNRLDPAELPDIGAHAYRHTYPGDIDTDHDVDADDLCLFAPDWLGIFLRTDLNGDGIVDSADFAVFAQDWQQSF